MEILGHDDDHARDDDDGPRLGECPVGCGWKKFDVLRLWGRLIDLIGMTASMSTTMVARAFDWLC